MSHMCNTYSPSLSPKKKNKEENRKKRNKGPTSHPSSRPKPVRRGTATTTQRWSEARGLNIPSACSSSYSLFMPSRGPPSQQLDPNSSISSSSPHPSPARVGQSSAAQHSSPAALPPAPLFCSFSFSLYMGLVRGPYCSLSTPY